MAGDSFEPPIHRRVRKSYARMRASANAIVATGDSGIEYQFQGDETVKKNRPAERDLRLHTRFKSSAGGKNNFLDAHHCGLPEAEQGSEFRCCSVTQLQGDRVPVRRSLERWPGLWTLSGAHFILPNFRWASRPARLREYNARSPSVSLRGNKAWVRRD